MYIGDKLNLIYRFKGVFFLMLGICVLNRKKTIGLYAKKKNFFLFFVILLKIVRDVFKFDTYFFNNIKWKIVYRLNNN